MKVYTRTGDKGTTSLFSNQRVSKNHPLIEALGAVDEANSAIGVAYSFIPKESEFSDVLKELEIIQHALFDVGAALATPQSCHETKKLAKTSFDDEAIDQLERWIDRMDERLPPLKTFILPGGHTAGAMLHLARSLSRRAERFVTPLFETEEISQSVLVYLNRLSDYLFVLSRYVNHLVNIPEIAWKPHQSHPK